MTRSFVTLITSFATGANILFVGTVIVLSALTGMPRAGGMPGVVAVIASTAGFTAATWTVRPFVPGAWRTLWWRSVLAGMAAFGFSALGVLFVVLLVSRVATSRVADPLTYVAIGLVPLVVGAAAGLTRRPQLRRFDLRAARAMYRCCGACGYDLTGQDSGRCPECGEEPSIAAPTANRWPGGGPPEWIEVPVPKPSRILNRPLGVCRAHRMVLLLFALGATLPPGLLTGTGSSPGLGPSWLLGLAALVGVMLMVAAVSVAGLLMATWRHQAHVPGTWRRCWSRSIVSGAASSFFAFLVSGAAMMVVATVGPAAAAFPVMVIVSVGTLFGVGALFGLGLRPALERGGLVAARWAAGDCLACGYALVTIASMNCPECGEPRPVGSATPPQAAGPVEAPGVSEASALSDSARR